MHSRVPRFIVPAALSAGLCFVALGAGADAADTQAQELPVRGVVRPVQQAVIATDLFAQVAKLPFKEGEGFSQGDLLIEFNCTGYRAQKKAAEAEHRASQLEYQNQKVLAKHKAIGRHELEIAATKVSASAAKVEELASRTAQCRIAAPFSGRVATLSVNQYEMPAAGSPLVTIIDDNAFEIELIVPSQWLNWLTVSGRFAFEVDETRQVLQATISRFGAAVDPVSQTITVIGKFDSHPQGVKAGMSGMAHFAIPEG